jgi:hypothetical protein
MPRTGRLVLHGMRCWPVLGVGTRGVTVAARLLGLGHHGDSEASRGERLEVHHQTTAQANHYALRTRAAITIAMT